MSRAQAQGTFTFVQVNSATPQSAAVASVTVKFTAAQTAGNLNVVVVGWNDATAQVQAVTDTLGNTYQRAVGPTVRAGSGSQSIYYAANIAAASPNSNTVTVTFSPSAAMPDVRIAEYSGVATVNPVDVVAGASGSGTSSDSGTAVTTSATDLLVGANTVQTHATGPGSGFTQRIVTSPDGDILEDRVVTATGSYNATAPMPSGWWVMQMVAFRGASGDTQPPTAPGTPVPTVNSPSQISLSWPAATDDVGVTGYFVERCSGASCSTFAQIASPTTTSFVDMGLAAATSYSYRVRATDAAGNLGPYSPTATATTTALDTQPPTAPGTPVLTVTSGSQISLAWSSATDNVGVTGYFVERCSGVGCSTFTQIAAPTTTSLNDTGLSTATSYSYRVRATDAAGNLGPYSAVASATTLDTQAPTAPGTPVLTVNSGTQISLSWTAATDNVGVTGYFVDRCSGVGCSTFTQIAAPTTTSFNDTGLSTATSYSYRVRATDAASNVGPYSGVASATTSDTQPPTAPGTPTLTVNSSSQIAVSWVAATDNIGVTGYFVERCAGASCSSFAQIAAPTATTFNDTIVAGGTTYSYRIRATDAAGNLGPYSGVATATTPTATTITFVQVNAATPQNMSTSVPVTYTGAQTAGDFNVVIVGWNDSAAVAQSVTDTKGNPYTLAIGPTLLPGFAGQSIYYAANITGASAGGNTVTVLFDRPANSVDVRIVEYRGVATQNPIDATAALTGTSALSTAGPLTTTTQNDMIVAANMVQTHATGPGTGFTQRVITSPDGDILEDEIAASPGSYTATAPLSSGWWVMQAIALRPGGAVPDLTITKSHGGSFTQGQTGATYSLTVTNAGAGVTTAPVTVTDTLPSGLSATAIAGAGWSCTLSTLTCTRSDALAASTSYPAIAVTVNVSITAPASVTNTATVSGGGELVTSNDSASDLTAIAAVSDLTIAKVHAGSFTQGQNGATYTLTVTNGGAGITTAPVTVTDTLPTGLSATAIAGTGWSCTLATLTCTRSDTLAAAASYPSIVVTVNVSASAPTSVTNTATVSGGGELITSNDSASDPTTIAPVADLTITKSHAGSFMQGQTGATYAVTVTNSGAGATTAAVTVTDTLPTGLTATAIAGTGWSCTLGTLTCTRSDALGATASYPTLTVTVNVSATAPTSVTNTATVSGGGEVVTTNDSANDATTIGAVSDLTITKSHAGSFAQGQTGATYTLTATNSGTGATSGLVTVTDTLPTGLSATAIAGTGWSCTLATLTCTRSDVLAASASYPAITLTVNVSATAPASVTNRANVSGGAEVVTTNDTATDPTTINAVADLTIAKTHSGSFTQGQTGATYTLAVTNAGTGATTAAVTVTDTLPTGLTASAVAGTGWSCTLATLTCTRSDALAAAASYPSITLTVNVSPTAPTSVTNTATVSGGGEVVTTNDTATDVTTIVALSDLTITKSHAGSFTQGQTGATYTLTVTNSGTGATTAAVTVTDTLPTGLTATAVAGSGWSCTLATLTCTRSDVLAAATSYPPITLTVNVSPTAPTSVTNTATVSGGGEVVTTNDTATDLTAIGALPDLTITKSHAGSFTQGQTGATYTLTVTNGGTGATTAAVTVTDTLPTGLTATAVAGTGWSCTLATLTCTRSDALAAAASYPVITLTVNVSATAPASVTNNAGVSGGGEVVTTNNTATDVTAIGAVPDLTITKSHAGSFTQGQTGATYTLTVTNSGAGATTAAVTVTDTLPTMLTATAIGGSGWSCTLATLTCTRGDALAATTSYPPITLTVNVSATAPASVTNTATVSGGGETVTTNDSAVDLTAITGLPDVTITKTHAGSFTPGQTGATYTLSVTNSGPSATTAPVTVTDTLPSSLTATAIAGTGWSCTLATLTCTRGDALAAAASYPPITLTVNVSASAPASVTNTATVSGGGEGVTTNDTANDITTITSSAQTGTPVFITEVHSATDGAGAAFNQSTLTMNITGTNRLLLLAWHAEYDGGTPNAWTVTCNGVPGQQIVNTNGYNGGANNQRFRIYYWLNPPLGQATLFVGNPYTGGNELAVSAILLGNVLQTNPLGALSLDVSTTRRTGETETVATAGGDLVVHVIADALTLRGTLGAGETSVSVANDGTHAVPGNGDASLWLSVKPATGASTTVSSSGWASSPSPAPRVINGVGIVVHGVPDTQPPSTPGNLTPTRISATEIDLSWNASTDDVGVTGYRIERCQSIGCTSFVEIGTTPGATLYNDTGVAQATSYMYRVRATDAAGNLSAYSNVLGVTTTGIDSVPPSAPGTLIASAINGSRIDLSWGAATDDTGVVNYRVARCDGAGCTDFQTLVNQPFPTGTSYSDVGLSPGTSYTYMVRASDAAENLGPFSNAATVSTPTTNPHLIAAYSFDAGSGTTVSDDSGHGNTGTIVNAAWTASGRYGQAMSFNGANARITIADTASLHLTTGMTLEAWVKPAIVAAGWRDVIYKGDDNYFLEATTGGTGTPGIGLTVNSVDQIVLGPTLLPVNTWTHLAATYDGATARLYINGALVASQPWAGAILTSTNPLEIGGDGLYGQFFQGTIDEVRVYDIALSAAQLQDDVATPVGATHPAAALNAGSIDFGSVAVGVTSAASVVTVTNNGTAALTIDTVTVSGTNSGDFAQTNTCTTVAINSTCTISVTMKPTTAGPRTASVVIADSAPGSPHGISLSGLGTGFTITPRTVVVTPGVTQQFSVAGNSGGVTWSVDGVAGGSAANGTITTSGLYLPPSTAGSHTVTVNDSTKSASATAFVSAYTGVLTQHNDNLRTGQNTAETVLTTSNVTAATFGKLFTYPLDGVAHASPLYLSGVTIPGQGVHNVVYIATEHDSVYAFDADNKSGTPLWKTAFINAGAGVITVPAADTGECCDIAPEIGITGTPVIDASTGTLYVVAATKETAGSTTFVQRLHALDIATGAEKFGGPMVVQATVPGVGNGSSAGQLPFDSLHESQESGLLLANGTVYIGFTSHGETQPYHGWVLGYSAATLQQVFAYTTTPNSEGAGVFSGALASDAGGQVYFVTGNGRFDANQGGADFGDSVLRMSGGGTIGDYFAPFDQATLNANGIDLGSAGTLLLPDQPGGHPHLLISAGMNGTIYVVDRDNLGHFNASGNGQIVQSLPNAFPYGTPEPGNFGAPVYFNGAVYFSPNGDTIQVYTLTNGLLSTTLSSQSAGVFAYPGAALAVSANGTTNGIVWAVERSADATSDQDAAHPGVLHAFDARNLATELYNSTQVASRDALAGAAKFSNPIVANGKVFVATVNGLSVYGLIP